MEAIIISLLISVLSILQNPSVSIEQKVKIYNQVIPIVQNMNRELHDKADKVEALRIEEMKKAEVTDENKTMDYRKDWCPGKSYDYVPGLKYDPRDVIIQGKVFPYFPSGYIPSNCQNTKGSATSA